jgi:hypothetical protein
MPKRFTERDLIASIDKLSQVALRSVEFNDRQTAAVISLGMAAEVHRDAPDNLIQAVVDAHKVLGAPGDFGYGTPEGEAMRWVYDIGNRLANQRRRAARIKNGRTK